MSLDRYGKKGRRTLVRNRTRVLIVEHKSRAARPVLGLLLWKELASIAQYDNCQDITDRRRELQALGAIEYERHSGRLGPFFTCRWVLTERGDEMLRTGRVS